MEPSERVHVFFSIPITTTAYPTPISVTLIDICLKKGPLLTALITAFRCSGLVFLLRDAHRDVHHPQKQDGYVLSPKEAQLRQIKDAIEATA